MKLEFFNPTTMPDHKPVICYLTLRKNGCIGFTGPALKLLDLKIGSTVEFIRNTENGDFYIHKKDSCFEIKKLGQQLGISKKKLVEMMWPAKAQNEKSIHVIVNESPINYDGMEMYLITIPKK